jgi:hypothetical protein
VEQHYGENTEPQILTGSDTLPRAEAIIEAESYSIDAEALMAPLDAVYDVKLDSRRHYQKIDEIPRKA